MANEPSLSPLGAHNAVAGLLALYTGILADYERQLQFANAQMARDKAAHADQLKEGKALNEKLLADVKLLGDTVNATAKAAERQAVLAAGRVFELFEAYARTAEHANAAVVKSAVEAVRGTILAEKGC